MSFISFPKIRHVYDVLHYIRKTNEEVDDDYLVKNNLVLLPTVKLHGSNITMVWRQDTPELQIQSRNKILDHASDPMGAVAFIHDRKEHANTLVQKIRDFYENKVDVKRLVLAMEYCGGKIQANVALTQVPRMMVITAIMVNHSWIDYEIMKEILSQCDIHSLNKAQFYHIFQTELPKVSLDIEDADVAIHKLNDMTMQIDKECPFVLSLFGKTGTGEGIVCRVEGYEQDPGMWFKMKGETHCESKPKVGHRLNEEQKAAFRSAQGFANGVVTSPRLEQGLDYLKEAKGSTIDKSDIPNFLRWVVNDVITEHNLEIEEMKLNEKQIKKEISILASKYFLNFFNQC